MRQCPRINRSNLQFFQFLEYHVRWFNTCDAIKKSMLQSDVIGEPIYPVPIFACECRLRCSFRARGGFLFAWKRIDLCLGVGRFLVFCVCVRNWVVGCFFWVGLAVWRLSFVLCCLTMLSGIFEFFNWHLLDVLCTKFYILIRFEYVKKLIR